jgi:hypothetical protein
MTAQVARAVLARRDVPARHKRHAARLVEADGAHLAVLLLLRVLLLDAGAHSRQHFGGVGHRGPLIGCADHARAARPASAAVPPSCSCRAAAVALQPLPPPPRSCRSSAPVGPHAVLHARAHSALRVGVAKRHAVRQQLPEQECQTSRRRRARRTPTRCQQLGRRPARRIVVSAQTAPRRRRPAARTRRRQLGLVRRSRGAQNRRGPHAAVHNRRLAHVVQVDERTRHAARHTQPLQQRRERVGSRAAPRASTRGCA